MNDGQAVKALAALAQESRLRVFRLLVVAGAQGATPTHISEQLAISATNTSFHLKELSLAGLATQERGGRNITYRADIGTMNQLIGFLTANCCGNGADAGFLPLQCPPVERSHMSDRVFNVLFLCTANSARSILAESILNQLGRGRFIGYSAGSHPAGQVHGLAREWLERNGFASTDLRSKSWTEFSAPAAPVIDFVLTVCDKAAGETCPVWPGQPLTANWSIEDPVKDHGSEEAARKAIAQAAMALNRRIAVFLSLPMDRLDRISLQHELNQIGQTAE